jgi:hypothetical protein
MRLRFACVAVLTAMLLTAVACSGPADPSQNVTETVTGSVAPASFGLSSNFNVGRRGEYFVTFISLVPQASVFLGVSLGQVTNGTCSQSAIGNPQAARGQVVLSGSIDPGTYCLYVFDTLGVLNTTTAFTFSVNHP